jgi:hypothetical protein
MQQIDAFLDAYKPKCICFHCLAAVTGRSQDEVTSVVNELVHTQRAATKHAECFNCNVKGLVAYWRPA